jgi:molybdopterin converting factor subunit 1
MSSSVDGIAVGGGDGDGDDDDGSTTITIHILLFASAREAAGNVGAMNLQVGSNDCDTSKLRRILADRFPKLATMVLDEDSITLALNEEYVQAGQVLPLKQGDTVALIPPISGG